MMTTTTRPELDDLMVPVAANDVSGCSPNDPVAGMALVKQIAASVARRLPSHVDRDELISLGALGYAEARQRFDAARGVPFAGFAALRIRGAILDGLRQSDTLSRGDRRRARATNEPTLPRVVGGLSSLELETALAGVAPDCDPGDALAQHQMSRQLQRALATLSAREQHVLRRFFFEEIAMRAIGDELGVTESRVSQIVTAAVARLRTAMSVPAPIISLASRRKSRATTVSQTTQQSKTTKIKEAA
jgi:RNA polymerase sigma factor for flagellar operon FliA